MIDNSDLNEIASNSIVASAHDAILVQAANANWIHDNALGTLANSGYGYYDPFSNGGAGIDVANGSSDNRIGAIRLNSRSAGLGNNILNNKGAGVWLQPGAGTGNSVLENSIALNGALAIDLGTLGPSYGNSGVPNNGRSAPLLQQSYLLAPQTLLVDFSLSGTSGGHYRVDVYFDPDFCGASGYGPATYRAAPYFMTLSGVVQNIRTELQMPYALGLSQNLAATATDLDTGDTSQISNCVTAHNDRIFAEGFAPGD